jgi:hypothetical protein
VQGIVRKNAIMMIDFVIDVERDRSLSPDVIPISTYEPRRELATEIINRRASRRAKYDVVVCQLGVEVLEALQFIGSTTNNSRPVHEGFGRHEQVIHVKCVTAET